jgi:hypothetical protein
MTQVKLSAVDQTLAFASPDIPPEHVESFDYTLAWAQAVARRASPDPSSLVYFDTMVLELQRVGWNVISAGSERLSITQDKIAPSNIISSVLDPYLGADQKAQLDGILNAIQQPDVGIHNFLEFWWNHASVQADKTEMAIGPLFEYLGQPSTVLLHYTFHFSADNWRALFVERDSAELQVGAYHLEMNENIPLWRQIKDTLEARFGVKVNDHVQNTDADI